MGREKNVTPYRRLVLAKLAADGPLTLKEAVITQNVMPTLLFFGWARLVDGRLFEITDAGIEALHSDAPKGGAA